MIIWHGLEVWPVGSMEYPRILQEREAEVQRERKRRRQSLDIEKAAEDEEEVQKRANLQPGDPGFRWHARSIFISMSPHVPSHFITDSCESDRSIPAAARLDYTRRPESQVAGEPATGSKSKPTDRMSKRLTKLSRAGKSAGKGKAAHVSVQGRGLAL